MLGRISPAYIHQSSLLIDYLKLSNKDLQRTTPITHPSVHNTYIYIYIYVIVPTKPYSHYPIIEFVYNYVIIEKYRSCYALTSN